MAKVSIIMPAYNAEQSIGAAIQSVCGQTFSDWELIVVDDASIDKTAEIVQEISAKDKRVLLFIIPHNVGVAAARNHGLSLCTGEYVAFLDSDDIWHKDKLQRQLVALTQTNADLCFTAYNIVRQSGTPVITYDVPSTIDYQGLLKENVMGCSTVLLRSSSLGDVRFKTFFFHEDYVLWLEMLRNGCRAVGVQQPLVYYRLGGRSDNKINAAKERWNIYRKSEHLSLIKSFYYFCIYCKRGLRKYNK